MKYCKGKFHGSVRKEIEDSEKYCLICTGRYKAEKDERNKKIGKAITTTVAIVATPLITAALSGADS